MKLNYTDGKQRCRFCGHVINEGDKTTVHQVADYRENDGLPWEEPVHVFCDENMPSATIELREGYRRYSCQVLSPTVIRVILDRGLNIERVCFRVGYMEQWKMSVIRDSQCIYFKNQLLVEIPEDIVKVHLQ